MPKAIWNGTVLAESDNTVIVDNNHYFPPESLNKEIFKKSDTTSYCGWKGTANYYNLEVEGQVNQDAAWCYRDPLPAAASIKDHVAFWKDVQVEG